MQSIRKEIHTLLNNELKALKETLESLERIGVEKLTAPALIGLKQCFEDRVNYTFDMYAYLRSHPLYKGDTKAIESKVNAIDNLQVLMIERLNESASNLYPTNKA